MPIAHVRQPETLVLSPTLRLRRFQGEFAFALPWYQDRETLLLVDGKEEPYDLARLERMYRYLDSRGVPDPDLIIRPSGELRLSNFLPWQSAYAEFYFTDVLWPDFGPAVLDQALIDYQRRQRRFGGV